MTDDLPPEYMQRFFVEAQKLLNEFHMDLEAIARLRNALWPDVPPLDIEDMRRQLRWLKDAL